MDFLYDYDGSVQIKKQTLKTSCGKLMLYKQTTNTCARIQVAESALSVAEPTGFLKSKGRFIAKTLVDPNDEDCIMCISNLTDEAVKINQQSIIGSLQKVDNIFQQQAEAITNTNTISLPLQPLIQNISDRLNPAEKDTLMTLIDQYQNIFVQSNGQLGQTHIFQHEIKTGETKPIKIPPRRIPIFKRQTVDQEIDKMLE